MNQTKPSAYLAGQATRPRASGNPWLLVLLFIVAILLLTVLIHTSLGEIRLGADFYTFWLAGKAMLLEHSDPYSAQVTLQSQIGIYGRAALPGEDQVAFAYPPYSVLAILPLVFLPFDWAYSAWFSTNVLVLLTLLYLLFRKQMRLVSLSGLLLFPVFICLVTGNFSVWISSILLIFFGWIVSRNKITPPLQIVSAVLLAWTTAKPQFAWLFLLFICIYALRRRLYYFLGAFFGALLAFFAFSFLFVPNWISAWLGRVQQYAGYVNSQPTLNEFLLLFLPRPAVTVVSAVAFILGLVFTAVLLFRWWKGTVGWLTLLAWIGMFTYLFHLHGMSYDQMTFLTPLLLWTGQQVRWNSWPVLVFWFGSILVSWLAFALGMDAIAVDRAPVLYNAIWVAWLFFNRESRATQQRQVPLPDAPGL